MRSAVIVAGLVVIGLIAALLYNDLQTRAVADRALAQADKAQAQLAGQKAAIANLSAQLENRVSAVHKTRVTVYFHDSGLREKDAGELASRLKRYGFDVRVTRHPGAGRPDAVFIGAFVGAEEGQLVLSSLPYEVEYIFRADYPRQLGGDPEGRSIGIGYVAAVAAKASDPRAKPTKVSRQQLASLLQPKLSNAEFQLRLRKIASP